MTLNVSSLIFDNKKVFVDVSFADIIPWFIDNRKEDIKRIKEFVEFSDFDQVQRMGHRWKGTCASYGFQKLSEAGQTLEELATHKNSQEILNLLDQTSDYINHLEVVYVSPSDENDDHNISL